MTLPRAVLAAVLLSLAAGQLEAVAPPESPVAAKSFRDARLDIPTRYVSRGDLTFDDPRAGRPASLILSEPLLPGSGVGNTLEWKALGGIPADEAGLKDATWAAVLDYLERHEDTLRVARAELGAPRIGVFEHGTLIQVFAPRSLNGIPVRDSGVTAVVNHGNLVLLGLRNWGDAGAAAAGPRIAAEQARTVVSQHAQPFFVDSYAKDMHLEYIPVVRGEGYDFRLTWVIKVSIQGDTGTWEGLVDAVTGELIAFEDRNQYAARRVTGGVYPVANDQRVPDGVEQAGWPMPFVNVTTPGGVITTNAAGTVGCVAGTLSTSLVGRYARITDLCGAINETSAAGDLDLGFGPTPAATNCVVPAGHSAGDTKAARSVFYGLNRINEQARGWLPNNAWLGTSLLATVNDPANCNTSWNGTSLRFGQGVGCVNIGETPTWVAHEWGHGLDNNGVVNTISSPGEAIADVHAALRFNLSCIGRGGLPTSVCSGYGDQCTGTPATGCTGVRDLDFALHRCNQPHTISWVLNGFTSAQCGGSGTAPACPMGGGTPCGRLNHCEALVASETVWDLQARDLRAAPFNLDGNTALELATRLAYLGSQTLTAWHTCGVGGGCGATGGYLLFLAADDDDGNITNGTPHMSAIRAAFQRHEIHCATPAVSNNGCSGGPTTAPVLTAVAQDQGVTLTWTAVSGASRYYVYRTEGVSGPGFGKVKIGEVTGTTFLDTNLMTGRPYFFAVLPVGANTFCFGLMSNSVPVTPVAGANLAIPAVITVTMAGGDGDAFLDNCETATVGFTVENTGTGALTNVRLVAVTFLTHPTSVLQTTLPAPISASLADCATANGAFAFILQGATNNQTTQIRIDVTADQLVGQVRSQVISIGGLETDAVAVATRTYDFDTNFSGWTVAAGSTYNREAPGANATAFHLHSSALLNDQCDLVRSPVISLRANSTLSLFNRYVTETPVPVPYDRANIGVIDLNTNARTTILPSGGRLYELPAGTPNGACATTGQAGWAGSQAAFAQSTWSSGALNPGGVFTGKRVQIEAAYGTDSGLAEDGFRFDEVTVTNFDDLTPDAQANVCAAAAVAPVALAVDTAGNAVMEPNELAIMAPTWRNIGVAPVTLTGATTGFTGPAGPVYTNPDNAASFGTIGIAAQASCATGGNCYSVNAAAATRPLTHWDTTILETVNPSATTKTWTLHIGASFTDVPTSNSFYRFVETALHRNATGGCTPTTYCPSTSTTREQMAVLVLRTFDPTLNPPACGAPSMFADVPASSPFCRWIEELARRGVVSGCATGLYCPSGVVTREQMPVFVLRTLDPALNPPACGTPVFTDVPASSPFCRWIEELVRRGVVSGCGGGNYCPTNPVTREQMAVFLTVTFGLTLYGL